jgi:hypothetical protein
MRSDLTSSVPATQVLRAAAFAVVVSALLATPALSQTLPPVMDTADLSGSSRVWSSPA